MDTVGEDVGEVHDVEVNASALAGAQCRVTPVVEHARAARHEGGSR